MLYETKNLIQAIRRGDIKKVRALLDSEIDLEDGDDFKRTPLHCAVISNQPHMVAALLEAGANPNTKNRFGIPATFAAIKHGNIQILQMLYASGANIDLGNNMGYTALHWAIEQNKPKVVEFLLSKEGIDANLQTAFLEAPIHVAIREKSYECLHMLLAHGVNVDIENSLRFPPLAEAAAIGDVYAMKLLLNHGAKTDFLSADKYSLAEIAAEWNQPIVFQFLIQENIPLNLANGLSKPLDVAAKAGNFEVVEFLLDNGYSVCDDDLPAPSQTLQNAVRGGHVDLAAYLISKGANPQWQNASSGENLLHEAARCKEPAMLALLLPKITEVNTQGEHGNTPLHLACFKEKNRYLEILLSADCNVNAQNDALNTPLYLAAARGDVEKMILLLKAGADPNLKNKQGKTAFDIVNLKIAVYTGYLTRRTRDKHKKTLEKYQAAKEVLESFALTLCASPKPITFDFGAKLAAEKMLIQPVEHDLMQRFLPTVLKFS